MFKWFCMCERVSELHELDVELHALHGLCSTRLVQGWAPAPLLLSTTSQEIVVLL